MKSFVIIFANTMPNVDLPEPGIPIRTTLFFSAMVNPPCSVTYARIVSRETPCARIGNKLFLIGCFPSLSARFLLERERFADYDGCENQHEADKQAQGDLLAVQRNAEQHAEHRFQA